MTEPADRPDPRPLRHTMTARARDFAVLAAAVSAMLFLLAATGSLGLVEAVSGILVFASFAAAYFYGSAAFLPPRPRAPPPEPPASVLGGAGDVLSALPMPAFEVDGSGKIIAFNDAADMLLRLRGRLLPRAGSVIRSEALLEAISDKLAAPGDGRATVEVETGPDESWRAHVARVPGQANVLVVLEDQTPVKRAARARADFLANASHELRTPLTAISGFIETMRGPARDDRDAWDRFLTIMAGETERMSRLIADLLSLSRIESSEHIQPRDREDLADIVSDAADVLGPLAADRGVTLSIVPPETPLPLISASRDELVQVLENLVSNALKYSKPGDTVSIRYGTAPTLIDARAAASQAWPSSDRMTLLQPVVRGTRKEPAIWLRVEDQGPGIENQHLPRLGERFYRADQSRGGKITGTGLGLAIVKHIMAHHRGGLAVETRLGEGTAFSIWLPAAPD